MPSDGGAPVADQKQRRLSVDDKFADDLDVLATFLDPHPAARSKTTSPDAQGLWSWRQTLAFVLVASLIGWSVVLGLVYLLDSLF